ncbi:MAG: TonB-dependent receptor [Gemmatimonadaceae bacterium]|nr:TonB-dependent receptor [Gemmatimonadaceae bacterium]
MIKTRLFIAIAAVFAMVSAGINSAAAQGVTTGAFAGTVTDANGAGIANAQVQVTNRSTGFSTGGLTREGGSFLVQGLETGGPYTVTVRRIGYQPITRDNLLIRLSTTTRVDLTLTQQAAQLSGVVVSATASTSDITPTNTGTKTTLSDTIIQRLPTTGRNLNDFLKLTPQVSTTGPGNSAGGMSNRMNNVQIDGATERDVFGLGSTGQPGGQIGAKAISIDAVKEIQVLLAPFDVRQGNFGGLLLNAVTKSGTNDWHGSGYRYFRNQDYGRNVPTLRATNFERDQYGFTLGGPIIKDKLHFFTGNEWTRESTPVSGPFQGQPAGSATPFNLSDADFARINAALVAKGLADPGTLGALNSPTPTDNLFGRFDYQINDVHRLVARFNYTDALNDNRRQNSRSANQIVYSSNFHTLHSVKKAPVVQLFSNFKNGWANELFVGANIVRDRRTPHADFPQVRIRNGSNSILVGADVSSTGNEGDFDTYEFTDNLNVPRGNHAFVIGTRNELVKIRNLFTQNSKGLYDFPSIAAFENGAAGQGSQFVRSFILSQGGNAYFDALQTALYAQDTWTATPRFTLTAGIRADISNFLTENSYALAVDTAYGHHETAKGAAQFSPRLGFNWDATGDQVNQFRGGIGLFVGTPPYVWMENAYINNGRVIATLQCGTGGTSSQALVPAFKADVSTIQTCANGTGTKPIGTLNFLNKDLKFPQPMRANLAYDRVLGTSNVVATVEGLYSKTLNQLFFVNSNLAGPVATDKFGRVLYGTLATTGTATPTRPAAVNANGGVARFSTAIDLENQNKDYSYSLTGQLRKRYSDNWEALIAYTYSHAYDVQSLTSSTHASNYSFGRTLSTRQEDPLLGVSLFDQPHHVVGLLTKTFKWGESLSRLGGWANGLSTDITVSYQGTSGTVNDYVYNNDMNADGTAGNDLIYIPKDVNDQTEIRFGTVTTSGQTFTPNQQAAALDALISSTACLREQRGTIMKRNSCRAPFSNTWDLTIRQAIPVIAQHRVSIQFDVFNFGNALNKSWGHSRVNPTSGNSNITLFNPTTLSSTDPATAVPIVAYAANALLYDPTRSGQPQQYRIGNFSSNYWRAQIAARYSF